MSLPDANIYIEAALKEEKEQYKKGIEVAYMTAYWSRCDAKDFPKYSELMKDIDAGGSKADSKEQSAQQMFDIVKSLHKKFGGKVYG